MSNTPENGYKTPSLKVYGSAEKITSDQNSAGNDVPSGPDDDGDNFYSVGK